MAAVGGVELQVHSGLHIEAKGLEMLSQRQRDLMRNCPLVAQLDPAAAVQLVSRCKPVTFLPNTVSLSHSFPTGSAECQVPSHTPVHTLSRWLTTVIQLITSPAAGRPHSFLTRSASAASLAPSVSAPAASLS